MFHNNQRLYWPECSPEPMSAQTIHNVHIYSFPSNALSCGNFEQKYKPPEILHDRKYNKKAFQWDADRPDYQPCVLHSEQV